MTPPAPEASIVAMARKDSRAVSQLFQTAASEGGASGWNEAAVATSLDAGGFGAVARMDGGPPIGAVLAVAAGDTADIANIVVAPSARGRGVGRSLVAWVIGAAEQAGYEQVMLEVAADNAPALNLYSAAGFAKIGQRPNYYRRGDAQVSAEVMVLRLGARPTS